jgi:hypothetical protein
MKREHKYRPAAHRLLAVAGLLVLQAFGSVAFAQDPRREKARPPSDQASPGPSRQIDGGRERGPEGMRPFPFPSNPSFSFVSSEMRFDGKIVKGAPFSATAETEFVQTLGDGTRITRKTSSTIYRDGEGRTRREQTLNAVGPFATAGEPAQMVFISDPVSGFSYMLDPRNRTARKTTMRGGPPPMRRPPSMREAKVESLGKQTIEGIEADGTRSTLTIPAGQIGNDRPLEIVSERWYSPELQKVVLSRHSDPRMGEHTYMLKNVNRNEPERSLFEAPSDYTIKEDRPFGGRDKRGRRSHDEFRN